MARTETIDRPIHVEAPSWWRTALRYNLWAMFGVGAAIAAVLALAVFPVDAIGPGGGTSALFVLALVASIGCAVSARHWQRDDPEGYPLLLFVSATLALAGGLTSADALRRLAFEGPAALENPMLSVGFWTLVVAALVALATLVQLFGFARERRGRWIAVYVFVWSAAWAAMPQALLFGFSVVPSVSEDVRLPVVDDLARHLEVRGVGMASVVSLTLDGELQVRGRTAAFDDESAVEAELERVAADCERVHAPPFAIVALDRDERFGRAVELLDRCAGAGMRRVLFAAEPGSYEPGPGHWSPGGYVLGTGRDGGPWDPEAPRPSTWLEVRLVPNADDGFTYALDGGEPLSFDEFAARVNDRWSRDGELLLQLVADGDLRWEPFLRVVDALNTSVRARLDGLAVAD